MRRIFSIFLCLLQYWITVLVTSQLIRAVAHLLLKAGALEPWIWFNSHPILRGLLVGILAGLMPIGTILGALGRFRRFDVDFLENLDTEKPKRWFWLIFSPLLFVDLIHWRNLQIHNSSVFAEGSPYSIRSLVNYFLSTTDCGHVMDWSSAMEFECFERPVLHWLLATSIGFSLAPAIRNWSHAAFQNEHQLPHEAALPDATDESTMEVKTDTQ